MAGLSTYFTLCVVILIACFSSSLGQQNNGARLALNLKEISKFYNSHAGIFYMQSLSQKPIEIPDFSYELNSTTPYSFHNIALRLLAPAGIDISAKDSTSFSLTLSGMRAALDAEMTVGSQKTPLHITVNQTDINVIFKTGWNAASKKPTVTLTDIKITVADNSIDFHNSALNVYVPMIISQIRQGQSDADVKSSILENLNGAYIAPYLESASYDLNVDDYIISLLHTKPIENKEGFTYIHYDGHSHLPNKPSSCANDFAKHEVPASASVQVYATPDMLRCLFYTFVEKLNTLQDVSRPFGAGSVIHLSPDFKFKLENSGRIDLSGMFKLDTQQNGKTVTYDVTMDATFDVKYPRHDMTGVDTSVTPRRINLKSSKPDAVVNDIIKKFQAKFPAGRPQNSTINTGAPALANFLMKYNLELNANGFLMPLQLQQ